MDSVAIGGDVSALVEVASTVGHTDAESCRVAVIGSQRSHVRPIKELLRYRAWPCACIPPKNYTLYLKSRC